MCKRKHTGGGAAPETRERTVSTELHLDLDPAIPGAETAVLQWPSCRSGGVALWMVHGGGHQPDFTDGFGEALWSFFAAHPVSR